MKNKGRSLFSGLYFFTNDPQNTDQSSYTNAAGLCRAHYVRDWDT